MAPIGRVSYKTSCMSYHLELRNLQVLEVSWRKVVSRASRKVRQSTRGVPTISRRVSPKSTTQLSITIHQSNNMPRKSNKFIDIEDIVDDDQPPEIEPYAVLGLEKTATPDDIKSAYRKAALKHHPGMHVILLLRSQASDYNTEI